METSHIKNTINYLKRHTDFYDNYSWDNYFEYLDYDDNSYLVEDKINELEYELKKRGENK